MFLGIEYSDWSPGIFSQGNQAVTIGDSKEDYMEALFWELGFPLAASAQGECRYMGILHCIGGIWLKAQGSSL